MNAIQFLNSLKPSLPLSLTKEANGSHKQMSNGEIRRLCEQGGVLINGENVAPQEEINFPVFSIVFFPKSKQKRTTI